MTNQEATVGGKLKGHYINRSKLMEAYPQVDLSIEKS